jgi:5-methyltetrahydropteroyltriglutamate--homocysteine methyltransferase
MNFYRADHVGSLLRPKRLLDARRAYEQGKMSRQALTEIEDQAILDVLAMQKKAGIDILSDGEFRRASWMESPFAALQGLQPRTASRFDQPLWQGHGKEVANAEMPIGWAMATEKIKLKQRFTGAETPFLKKHAPGPFKITMPGPTMLLNLYEPGVSSRVYPTRQDFLDDVVRVYQTEVDAQIADGASYIQLDSLRYAMALSRFPGPIEDDMSDVKGIVAQAIAADNAVLSRARAKNVVTAIHVCRGNHRSAWLMEGSYDAVAEQLFNDTQTDRFLLEYDDARSGSFAPLRFVPKGKIVVLGLVSSKLAELESQDELMRRVDEASRYVPLEQLALSPQCGFASTELGNLLSEDEERRKLELVAKTARRIWG